MKSRVVVSVMREGSWSVGGSYPPLASPKSREGKHQSNPNPNPNPKIVERTTTSLFERLLRNIFFVCVACSLQFQIIVHIAMQNRCDPCSVTTQEGKEPNSLR
ncbi:unnamed protein product, partial [Scytosiphon promiscuus]